MNMSYNKDLSSSLASRREECIAQAVELLCDTDTDTDNDNDTDIISSSKKNPEATMGIAAIGKLHDRLLGIFQEEDEWIARTNGDLLRLRLQLQSSDDISASDDEIRQRVTMEADFYRAVMITSFHLLEIPFEPSNDSFSVKTQLERTIRQCTVLLNILKFQYCNCFTSTQELIAPLPSNHPCLDQLLDEIKRKHSWHDDDDTNLMSSFDREQLAVEEDELLQMASTPTPQEYKQQQQQQQQRLNTNHDATISSYYSLVARLSLDGEPVPIQVTMDDRGVFRPVDTNRHAKTLWWTLSSSSTIKYESPVLQIFSVVTNHPSFGSTTIKTATTINCFKLDVGRDGPQWWERASRIIQRLKELEELQGELRTLWPQDEYQTAQMQARQEVCCEATTLN